MCGKLITQFQNKIFFLMKVRLLDILTNTCDSLTNTRMLQAKTDFAPAYSRFEAFLKKNWVVYVVFSTSE